MIAAQIELIKEAAYRGQWRMLDNLYNNEYQQACSDLKEFLNGSIVNCAVSAGQIDALKWAWDQGIHGGTVMSSPVLRKVGTIMLWNGLERMAVLNHKLDQMLLCTGARAGHQ
jgi:hypothetical protein